MHDGLHHRLLLDELLLARHYVAHLLLWHLEVWVGHLLVLLLHAGLHLWLPIGDLLLLLLDRVPVLIHYSFYFSF